jgi:hypothetical protein
MIERAGLSALPRAERYDLYAGALSRKEIKAQGLRAGGRG